MADRNHAMTEAPRNAGVEEIRELTEDELELAAGGFDILDIVGKAAKWVWKTLGPR